MDYLEGKIELMTSQAAQQESICNQLQKQLQVANDKIKLMKESREKDSKDTKKHLSQSLDRQKILEARIADLERQKIDDRKYYTHKLITQKSTSQCDTPENLNNLIAQSEIKSGSLRSLNEKIMKNHSN